MSTVAHVEGESVGGIARAIEDMRVAANNARLRKLRRTRLRAAMLTIDQLLEELELLNLEGRSRPFSNSLFSLSRLDPNATRLELTSEKPPQRLVEELFKLQERLMRDLAGPKWDALMADENSSECAGNMSLPATRDGSPLRRDL